ncbi:hypothetical protein GCM10027176_31650 [Actinoallomurus bryophytorum]|uniref:Methyltransferase family protein n=1 Tax=Actinoallomurus bryophytorum TaxID=1490222 RepID=A0A543CFV0_9ACTN|nr:hypothetical protein [Actinoallomurus bryophytorum]TQL95986.1 hypothetical protein FB559_1503 [Actinoallomurus bryophytorum]
MLTEVRQRAQAGRAARDGVGLLTFTELRGWLRDAGFDEVTGHDENGDPLCPYSRRMIVVARR